MYQTYLYQVFFVNKPIQPGRLKQAKNIFKASDFWMQDYFVGLLNPM